MKTTTKLFIILPCLLAAAALFYGCKEDEFDNNGNDIATGYTYHITVETGAAQEQAAGNGKARSLFLSEDSITEDSTAFVVHSAWEAGDQLMAYNLSDSDQSTQTAYSLLTVADTNTQFSAFEGTLVSKNPIKTTDRLCFFYPGSASTGNDRTIKPVIKRTRAMSGGVTNEYYESDNNKIKRFVYLDLSRQDGSIETIGKKFDYQWAAINPTSVNGNEVNCTVGPLQREIAIWAIKLPDDKSWLEIDNIKSADVFDLSTGEFVTNNATSNRKYHIVIGNPQYSLYNSIGNPQGTQYDMGDDGLPRVFSPDGYIYVAVLPGTYYDVTLTGVSTKYPTTKTYKRVAFEKNKVYRTTLAPTDFPDNSNWKYEPRHPYVEVQGVKWAKGNFVHLVNGSPESSDWNPEYWGIAPDQFYIAGGKASLFRQLYQQKATCMDLFRFGAIASALNLTSGDCMRGGTKTISKQLYTDSLGQTTTTDTALAKYGDIVWFHTKNYMQKYRMPADSEMRALYEHANVKAARYCYRRSGSGINPETNYVFGLYFWTKHDGEPRVQIFPTQQWDQYDDVTALIQFDKGLFLPFTGKRAVNSNTVTFRYLHYFGGIYGQYMSDLSSDNASNWDCLWGNMEWNYTPNSKGEAKAIRPVWDETNTDTDKYWWNDDACPNGDCIEPYSDNLSEGWN